MRTVQARLKPTYGVVTPDCTGSLTLNVPSLDVTVHAHFVIDHDGAEIRAHGCGLYLEPAQ